MMRGRPRTLPSDIKGQTHGLAESTFVIFENLRARKMSHDFLIRGMGCASFPRYNLRNSISNHACGSYHRSHSTMRILLATVVLLETLAGCMCYRLLSA